MNRRRRERPNWGLPDCSPSRSISYCCAMKLISAYGRQHRQLVTHIDETRALLGESQHSRRLSTTHSADAGGRSRHLNLSSVIGSTFFRHRMIKAYCAADVPSSKSDAPCGSFGCQCTMKGAAPWYVDKLRL